MNALRVATTESAAETPSRNVNPFATCWTRPGAIEFVFPHGESIERLIAQLKENGWRGAIIGPHGSGKSTLLQSLKPAIASAGRKILAFQIRDGQPPVTRDLWKITAEFPRSQTILVIDGYERLALPARINLLVRCALGHSGLLVTSHRQTCLPTLAELRPNSDLIRELVRRLTRQVSIPIENYHIDASHACHGSNVREIFFALYQQHEALRCLQRTGGLVNA